MRSVGTLPPTRPRRWRPAGGPVAGAQLGLEPLDHQPNVIAGYWLLALISIPGYPELCDVWQHARRRASVAK
jgi:hypothetical protein